MKEMKFEKVPDFKPIHQTDFIYTIASAFSIPSPFLWRFRSELKEGRFADIQVKRFSFNYGSRLSRWRLDWLKRRGWKKLWIVNKNPDNLGYENAWYWMYKRIT